ncbi:tRNA pseudouridine(13) synthase TruD [Natronomonas pharaonis DSM 2160]|uniref:Probable tRNA pseudouridine synthase D n=1 Tax=Natronomonas pharaonis (strain ATCC 35678 / DSM 2160 / CIP 103997 / JCM 8858 / NBRC 14720 / NCIMB 2260 / Gabara) TaxID=348780 RepID=TRUD_NATPD|nr:tRNA pseudouridine(13) synthase TruD [Natronomonas pharaonis]Q3IMF3.1 RecName: Full=Probable tRNA pseudouridine synthase D; AltName: Full=tRNA pseudouridine(13) synthase; AltName: Full=tRNA pseudouridylate synthase D; AltName: Full=tRNA-uridine isomerase D [Natronomonas pharaonis DSM 2160]CAI50705.1 tRNA pseudouridine(13) synthase TruD [Natronomonas pharaonis DSM 2160]
MRDSHPVEQTVGIEYYVTETDGTGGRLRDRPADFRVREREAFGADCRPLDADPGSYPHLVFRATLREWDTNDFASAVSNALGVSRERVSWAGTKDKHAVTTQLFSVRHDDAALPDLDGADIEPIGRAGRPVLFGDLAGNEFELVIRDPDRPEHAEATAAELCDFGGGEAGVPNYFGTQRFGSRRPITHRVGLDVLDGDWEAAAVRYVCESSEREPERTQEVREGIDADRDWAAAGERLPGSLRFERAIANRLAEGAESPDDYRAALEELPSNLQRMFVNAAQSYVFNRILSERLRRGLPFDEPVVGDVVCFSDSDGNPDPDRTQTVTESRLETVRRHCERGRAFVTAPLVGTETVFGDGEPAEITREVLADVDVSPTDFELPGEFGSSGTRRAVLVTTDLTVEQEPLTLSFSLPKGSYATVVAREFLKADPEALS